MEVFRRLAQEVLDSAHTIELMIDNDEELKALWLQYLEVCEFWLSGHFQAEKYDLTLLQ